MKRPTQADVARLAGVSRATVSYVLNDPSSQRIPISAETRQRVLETIAEVGYEVDARAQSLRNGSTKTIGVLVPIYENPFFWQLLRGIVSEAEAAGYSVLLSQSALTPEQERHSLRELAQQRVDGLILLIGFKTLPEPILTQLRNSTHPIVEITSTTSEFDHVVQGYGPGTKALLDHLLDLGHRRIGFIYGVHDLSQGIDRLNAFKQKLGDAGLGENEKYVVDCGPTMEDAYPAARELLRLPNRPTALLAINDLLAQAVLRAAADLGLRIPDDVSVAGFDDIPSSSFTVPRLTTVAGRPEANGRDAVKLLLRRLEEPGRPLEAVWNGWQLIIRESTGPVPR